MAEVLLDDVNKVYENGFHAVHDLDLEIADGEFLVLVGPSGCGKSTALRMVAGLEDISSGTLKIGDHVVNDVPPKDRDIAMVFQNYALYPHMTVADNISFALRLAKVPKDEIRKRVMQAAKTLQLEEWLERKPGQLSGGQRQRVAMGRAIVRNPSVFRMDEPLSNLDATLRVQMRAEIARLQRDLKVTTLYVTHDQVEAMTMGDRVAVLNRGVLQQVDAPERLYDQPDNLFVAAFIGSPSMNLLDAQVIGQDGSTSLCVGAQTIQCGPELTAARPSIRGHERVIVGIRPEDLSDASLDRSDGMPKLNATVELREALGSEILVHLKMDATPAITEDVKAIAADAASGDAAAVEDLERQTSEGKAMVVAKFDPRSRVKVGDTVQVAVSTDRLHFFDPATGLAIK